MLHVMLPFLLIFGFLLACSSTEREVNPGTVNVPEDPILRSIQLPDGFEISYFAKGVNNARSLALGSKGTVFVGTRGEGSVYAIQDIDGDYKADKKFTLISGLNMPNGVAFKDGDLYVAAVNRILIFRDIESNLENPGEPEIIIDDYPTDRLHGWKYIAFGPDNLLYVPVGAPCNICNNEDTNPIYASLTRLNVETKEREIVAHGIRNTVGFTWHPQTGNLWFTDNNRDMMGDDIPPGELNVMTEEGQHFGYPFLHASNILDPEFGKDLGDRKIQKPAQELGAHVAALGVKFYTGSQFPEEYNNNVAFLAEHGSWNRSTKIGYRISMVRVDAQKGTSYKPFAQGWLNKADDSVTGRPVDILFLPDGSMLISDDFAHNIYRITYTGA